MEPTYESLFSFIHSIIIYGHKLLFMVKFFMLFNQRTNIFLFKLMKVEPSYFLRYENQIIYVCVLIRVICFPYLQSFNNNMNIDALIETVLECKVIPEEIVKILCRKVKALLFEESNVQPVQAPVTICGDIHGQFWDLLQLFCKGGMIPKQRYLFLGDYVDRGYNSVETILLLFLYKLKYPEMIILLRGNHESRNITFTYGFYEQVTKKYGNHNAWYYFNEAFDYLPLAAVVEGQVFCVHGGLSPKRTTIDKIRTIERNMQIPASGPLCDLMWSDPQEGLQSWKQNPRGAGWLFGQRPVEQFNQVNEVKIIVRAHQLVQEGFKFNFGTKLVTVWSAPNYCYRLGNKAAILKLDSSLQQQFIVYEASARNAKNVNYANILPYFL